MLVGLIMCEKIFTDDGVRVSKSCSVSGNVYYVDLSNNEYKSLLIRNKSIQDILIHHSAEQREFLLSGYTPDEFDYFFKEVD